MVFGRKQADYFAFSHFNVPFIAIHIVVDVKVYSCGSDVELEGGHKKAIDDTNPQVPTWRYMSTTVNSEELMTHTIITSLPQLPPRIQGCQSHIYLNSQC